MVETEPNKIKAIVMNNDYPYSLIKKDIKLHCERLRNTESYGPQKLHVTLKLPFVDKKLHIFEKKIKLMTESIYSTITPRIFFVSKPMIKIELKASNILYGQKLCYLHVQLIQRKQLYWGNFSPSKN